MSDDLNKLSKTLETIQHLNKIAAGCRKIADQIDNRPDDVNALRCIRVLMKSQAALAEVIVTLLRENTKPSTDGLDFGDLLNTFMKK